MANGSNLPTVRKTDDGWESRGPGEQEWRPAEATSYAGPSGGSWAPFAASPTEVSAGRNRARLRAFQRGDYGAPSPYMQAYRDMLQSGLAGGDLGAGYKATPLYRSLQDQVTQKMRGLGQRAGSEFARRGMTARAGVGAGRRAATEQGELENRMRTQAEAAAYQARVGERAQYLDQLARGMGLGAGIMDRDFANQWKMMAAEMGLNDQEAASALAELQMTLGIIGAAAGFGLSAYDTLGGASGGGPVRTSAPNPIPTSV